MAQNLYSLGLLRNGKVYPDKETASEILQRTGTNDGVAKLARYLYQPTDGDTVVKTLIGFYANADEMEDNGGGQSYYTIIDVEGNAEDIQDIKDEISEINGIIGEGLSPKTLTDVVTEINEKLGSGFTEDFTVADALSELNDMLTEALTISLEESSGTSEYSKVYTLKQGNEVIGTINIPKDIVIKEGKLVHGTWSGDTFVEDPEGQDVAIKLVLNNGDVIYINAKDLVDTYTASNGIAIEDNAISVKLDESGEAFLTVGENGLKLDGVQTAIDTKVEEVAARERLEGSDGISIASNKVKAVAAGYSAPAIKNAISVGKDGIKLATILDCGYYDSDVVIASSAEDVAAIVNPLDADVFIASDDALDALMTKKTFKNIEVADVEADQQIYLYATDSINVDGMEVTGEKGSTNGKVNYSAPSISISNLSIANGSTAYNVFEGDQTNQNLEKLNVQYVTVDNPSLTHNVFNVYRPKDDCVINIKDSSFNLTVDNSNILRLANTANATGITVNFENVEWTYENGLTFNDWGWAGLIIFQPYSTDIAAGGDLSALETWTFNFKNCKYNGVKVTENNFGEHNQVFYLHKVGGIKFQDPVEKGLTLNFE